MKVQQVSVTFGMKKNLGDYSSLHAEINVWAELDEEDTEHEAAAQLWQMARENVRAQLMRVKPELRAEAEQVFLGLPKDVQSEVSDNGQHVDFMGETK